MSLILGVVSSVSGGSSSGGGGGSYAISITNPGFETGDTTGWTVSRYTVNVTGSDEGLTPHDGSYFVTGNENNNEDFAMIEQELSLSGVPSGELDDGSLKAVLGWYQANSYQNHLATALIRFLDSSDERVGVDYGPEPSEILPADTWELQTYEAPVPPGARKAIISLWLWQEGIDYPKVGIDDVSLTLEPNDLTPDSRKAAVIYFRSTTLGTVPTGTNEALGTSPAIANLVDTGGNSTGWELSTLDPFNQADDGTSFYATMKVSPIVPGPVEVTEGFIRSSISNDGELRISGLDTEKTYDVAVFCSIDNSGTQTTDYTVTGMSSETIRADGERNINVLAMFENVSPDTSGNIDILSESVSSYGFLPSLKIWEN